MLSRRPAEDGSVLPLVALTLVVLVVFAAFVIDLGPGYNERRQDQTAADAAALAGAAALPGGLIAVGAAVIAQAQNNLPSLTAADWTACTDNPPAEYLLFPPASPAGCIAVNAAGTRVHVKIPPRTITTNFAQVVGITNYKVSASADAQASTPGGVLPLPANTSGPGSGLICLKTPPNGQAPAPCDGSSGGNFGYLSTPEFGNTSLGTTQNCNGTIHTVLQNNLAVGIDHAVVPRILPSGLLDTQRDDLCGTFQPNHLYTQTGTTDDDLSCPLFDASNSPCPTGGYSDTAAGYPGAGRPRLQRGYFRTANLINGQTLDNEALAYFLDPALQGNTTVPASCWPNAFHPQSGATPANYKGQMVTCLTNYDQLAAAGLRPPPLFTKSTIANQLFPGQGLYDIQLSSRFAFVPQSVQDITSCHGTCQFDIASYRPVFIQTALFDCNANSCTTWDPLETVPSSRVHKLKGVTAFRFNQATLPAPVIAAGPGGTAPRTSLIR